jgi:hypothetical protein
LRGNAINMAFFRGSVDVFQMRGNACYFLGAMRERIQCGQVGKYSECSRPSNMDGSMRLQSVITSAELTQRPSRPFDHASVNNALVTLMQEMVHSPMTILQGLAAAFGLCQADSTGITRTAVRFGIPPLLPVLKRPNCNALTRWLRFKKNEGRNTRFRCTRRLKKR